jgi:hypothetical protein
MRGRTLPDAMSNMYNYDPQDYRGLMYVEILFSAVAGSIRFPQELHQLQEEYD